jgi:predicted glycoside hydrolase/deacetylase ChbG (UPF0249 family)
MCHASNEATLQVLKKGIVTSTTLMTPCPWSVHALRLLREHPGIHVGVHLTLVSESLDYRWGPRASRDQVSSLVDDSGYFHRYDQIPELLAKARLDEVEREFRAQIVTVLAAHITPTHLDWHCIADGGRADIFDLTRSLAQEYGLALRIHQPANAAKCQDLGLPTSDHPVLDTYGLGAVEKSTRYVQLLRELPIGLSEWAVHPSLGDVEAQAIEPVGWDIRRGDYDFFVSPRAREVIEEEGIVLLSFAELQRFWAQ